MTMYTARSPPPACLAKWFIFESINLYCIVLFLYTIALVFLVVTYLVYMTWYHVNSMLVSCHPLVQITVLFIFLSCRLNRLQLYVYLLETCWCLEQYFLILYSFVEMMMIGSLVHYTEPAYIIEMYNQSCNISFVVVVNLWFMTVNVVTWCAFKVTV